MNTSYSSNSFLTTFFFFPIPLFYYSQIFRPSKTKKRLEDADSEETKKWVQSQVNLTNDVLARCSPDSFYNDLKRMHNYPKFSVPFRRGANYYFWKNDGKIE